VRARAGALRNYGGTGSADVNLRTGMPGSRLSGARSYLENGPFTHIIVSDVVDVEYLCGFRSTNAFCIISRKKNILLSDFRYRQAAIAFCRMSRRRWAFSEILENDFSFCRALIPAGSVVGYQSNAMTVDQFGQLGRALRKVRFVKLPAQFTDIFVPKTETELDRMKQAAGIGDKAFSGLLRTVRAGMSEKDVARLLENECRIFGSERPSFDTIVLFGERASLPHGRPSDVGLKRGDWVLCDFGCTIDGFCSDMTRTFVMGKATERQKKIYDVVLRAQESGKAAVSAGVKACDVDMTCRRIISEAGFGKMFGHTTGHGVGFRIHEKPRISKTDNTILRAGTVITIEPGIYHRSFGGVRIEDMVIVRENGCEVITNSPRHLIEVRAGGIR
jgi:Xaa-Pro aminopeptidase